MKLWIYAKWIFYLIFYPFNNQDIRNIEKEMLRHDLKKLRKEKRKSQ